MGEDHLKAMTGLARLTASPRLKLPRFRGATSVNAALADLERIGVVEEVTGRKRGRVFGYRRYLAILGEGTEPLPASA